MAVLGLPVPASAQAPLIGRYESFFATPFQDSPGLILLSSYGAEEGRLRQVQDIAGRVFQRRAQDRRRIQRVVGGFGSPTGYEDANGDGVVTGADLDALDAFVFDQVRILGAGFTDEQLGIPLNKDPADTDDPERYQAMLDSLHQAERVCIELGCDHDQDGIDDLEDLCPALFDPDQGDADDDGLGDACDSDDNNNAVPDAWESCFSEPGGKTSCYDVLTEIASAVGAAREDALENDEPVPEIIDEMVAHVVHARDLLLDDTPALGALPLDEIRRLTASDAGRAAVDAVTAA